MAMYIVKSNLPFTHSLSLLSHCPYSYVSTSIFYMFISFFWQESPLSLSLSLSLSLCLSLSTMFSQNSEMCHI